METKHSDRSCFSSCQDHIVARNSKSSIDGKVEPPSDIQSPPPHSVKLKLGGPPETSRSNAESCLMPMMKS